VSGPVDCFPVRLPWEASSAMMGIKERDFRRLPADLSLEVLVPEDNFYGRLEERIDLSFVRELVRPLYAGGGRRSIDPVVFFKALPKQCPH
jgi:hypothetical protein